MDRRRYDSAMFWLAFGTAAAVIGLALMTIGVTRLPNAANPLDSVWFDGGLGLLVIGALLLLWALWLFLGRRRATALESPSISGPPAAPAPEKQAEVEAVRGYFAERERLFKMYEDQQQEKRKKGKTGA
jgi:type VI protein secretion system component VasK